MSAEYPEFEYQADRWFTTGLIVGLNIFAIATSLMNLFLFLCLLAGGGFVLAAGIDGGNTLYIIAGPILMLLSFGVLFFLYPLGQMNPYLSYRARKAFPAPYDKTKCCVVQVRFRPRIQKGIAATLDDADDLGVLIMEPDRFSFYGGAFRFIIPFSCVQRMESGFNLFPSFGLSGRRTKIHYGTGQSVGCVEIDARDSWFTFGQFRRNNRIVRNFRNAMPNVPYQGKLVS